MILLIQLVLILTVVIIIQTNFNVMTMFLKKILLVFGKNRSIVLQIVYKWILVVKQI